MNNDQLEEVVEFRRATEVTDPLKLYGINGSLYQSLQAAYVIHDSSTNILGWNQQALDLLGLSEDDIAGRNAQDPYWVFLRENETTMPQEEFPVNRVVRNGKPVRDLIVGIRKTESVPTIWVQVSADAILDDKKKLKLVVVTFMDVTQRIEAQKKLSNSERLYRSVIAVMQNGLVLHDRNGAIVECNSAAEQILGSSREKLCGGTSYQPNYKTIHEDGSDFPAETHPAMVTLKTGIAQENIVMGVYRRDSSLSWITINSTPIFNDSDPLPSAVVATFSDITAAKVAEKKLRASEELFRGLVEISPIAMLIVSGNDPHRILLMNRRFTELFGYDYSDLLDMQSWWIHAYPGTNYRKKMADSWQMQLDEMKDNGLSRVTPLESKVACRDGIRKHIEMHMAVHDDRVLLIFHDVTERKEVELHLKQAAAVFENISEAVMITDVDNKIVAINPAFSDITGYAPDDVLGMTPAILTSDRYDEDYYQSIWGAVNETGTWRGEVWNRRKSGELYPAWLTLSSVKEKNKKFTHHVGVFSDITIVKQSEEKLYRLAHHDPLTSLPNRLLFISQAEKAIQAARRNNTVLAVMFVDLDRFKHINDSMGHPAGDQIILEVAARLKRALRDKDTVARMGGDEFTVLIDDVVNLNGLPKIAKKLIQTISDPISIGNNVFCISASIGISVFPQDGSEINSLIANADVAMYRAKELGRSSFQFYTRDMTEKALQRATIESRLRKAIDKGEMSVYLQPRFNITSHRLVGAEALLHWENDQQGYIPAEQFIPLAEENGSIDQLGDFVLQHTCDFANQLRQTNLVENHGRFRLSVNISTLQLARRDIFSRLTSIISKSECLPSMLEFELTESLFAQPTDELIETMKKFRTYGISIAVDNFGVGFSSLNILRKFPIDRLKIDVTFVRNIPEGANDVAIARAVIALSHSLQLKVVAGGVETDLQHNFLFAEGCNEAQGYYYSKPVPPETFMSHLRDWL